MAGIVVGNDTTLPKSIEAVAAAVKDGDLKGANGTEPDDRAPFPPPRRVIPTVTMSPYQ